MAPNSSDASTIKPCENPFCKAEDNRIFFCASCDCFYCDTCWELQGPHFPGKTGLDGLPHEKTDINIVNNLKAILDPPGDPEALRRLHQKDESTTWFGVEPSEHMSQVTGHFPPIFKDYGRYATLMADSRPQNGEIRYPQLVSFIGQTNAGKSTVVKMLISHGERNLRESDGTSHNSIEFPSPVVGSVRHDNLPTSGDVHLYADPYTIRTQSPVLYADCEGLDGGEKTPLATQSRKHHASATLVGEATKKVLGGGKRILEWATNDVKSGRQYAVKHLYPRLLYTFSDVVVFVLKNPKVFESVLKLLIDWAAASLEKSLNQPILPHAIIVLNATDLQVSPEEWDPDHATNNLMTANRKAIQNVPEFRRYAEIWAKKGKEILVMEDLIKCYYSSITVVRIPAKGRYMLLNDQVDKLHESIMKRCDAAFYARERVRMLPHVDQLNEYLQAGFEHFSKRLDAPFNFVDIAVRNNPVPQNLGGHISNLAADMQRKQVYDHAEEIFEALSPFLASCFLLEAIRERRPGNVEEFFDKYYGNMCKAALDEFCDRFLPCSFTDSHGRTCQNMKYGHETKGHQDQNGTILRNGLSKAYQSNFTSQKYQTRWIQLIKQSLMACEARLQVRRHSAGSSQFKILEEKDAFELHLQEPLKNFFDKIGGAKSFTSMSTCYCCLTKVPEHPLPCGHVLCTPCIKNYGTPLRHSSMQIDSCPLHPEETKDLGPWLIRFKPAFAGVRILSLDGGGVRGIIELEILRAIELSLGGKIPVQRFFDLIVGTSTGGIIALGIGTKHWSVRDSIEKFTSLCDQAFTRRELPITVIKTFVTLRHGSEFKTKPLRRALNAAFGEQYLFGGEQESDMAYMMKVAVTSTSGTGQTPLIITNYGRQDDTRLNYRIDFSRGSQLGLRVWEAASATSAAPSIFKPFKHPNADRSYMDGGLYNNNPISVAHCERRLLWSDVADKHPDIMLSIGTGQNLSETRSELYSGTRSMTESEKRKTAIARGKTDIRINRSLPRRQRFFRTANNVKNFFSVLVNRIDNVLDSELAWNDFYSEMFSSDYTGTDHERYIRFNIDLGSSVPPLHAKDKLNILRSKTINQLKTPLGQAMLQNVAYTLIGSSFYFEKLTPKEVPLSEKYTCSGFIRCRFENGSVELRELGRFLRTKQTEEFQPYFAVKDQQDDSEELEIPLTAKCINHMIDRSVFDLGRQDLEISSRLAATTISLYLGEPQPNSPRQYPVSGFPRTLITEDSENEERLQRQRTIAKARWPDSQTSASNPELASEVERQHHERSASDSFIPKLVQRVLEEFVTPQVDPYRHPTKLTWNKQPAAGTSVHGQVSHDNLIDLDAMNTESQTDKLASFSPLTPQKIKSPGGSSANHDYGTPLLSRTSNSDFKVSGGGSS